MTTYSESAVGIEITKDRAFQELRRHGNDREEDFADFLEECGDKETYLASDVLVWLGY